MKHSTIRVYVLNNWNVHLIYTFYIELYRRVIQYIELARRLRVYTSFGNDGKVFGAEID